MPRNSQPLEDFIPSAAECGASLSLIDDDGRLLFALAGTKFDCPPGELFYMGIGGHRLSCEDFPTCARREALEEIGADVHLVDCGETWLITADGVESRLELADQPRPFALYLMANSVHTDDSQRTYYIAIYQATLLDPTFRDTLNKAITVWIVLAGAAMADENCLLRVVGDSSILSVSPHRGRCGPGAAP